MLALWLRFHWCQVLAKFSALLCLKNKKKKRIEDLKAAPPPKKKKSGTGTESCINPYFSRFFCVCEGNPDPGCWCDSQGDVSEVTLLSVAQTCLWILRSPKPSAISAVMNFLITFNLGWFSQETLLKQGEKIVCFLRVFMILSTWCHRQHRCNGISTGLCRVSWKALEKLFFLDPRSLSWLEEQRKRLFQRKECGT